MTDTIANSLRTLTELYESRNGSEEDDYMIYVRMIRELTNVRYEVNVRMSMPRQQPQLQPRPVRRKKARKSKAILQREIDAQLPDPCSICFETYTKGNSVSTSCGHTFCKTCYDNHEMSVNRRGKVCCPLCRTETPNIIEFRARKARQPKQRIPPVQEQVQVQPEIVIDLTTTQLSANENGSSTINNNIPPQPPATFDDSGTQGDSVLIATGVSQGNSDEEDELYYYQKLELIPEFERMGITLSDDVMDMIIRNSYSFRDAMNYYYRYIDHQLHRLQDY